MAEPRPLLEQWLDVALYLPLGVLSSLRAELPPLVGQTRQKAVQRVQVARWVGQMSVAYGKQELAKRTQRDVVAMATAPIELTDQPLAQHPPEPFEGYSGLPAAQIVQRLAHLPHGELHLVRAFETAHRGRRTVLSKVDQLLGS